MLCAPLCSPHLTSARPPIAFSTELYGHVATADAELHEHTATADTEVHRCTAKTDTKLRGRSASADRVGKELHDAAAEEDEVKVRGLLGRGASIEWRDETGLTALHMAARRGHVRVARLLLQAGADVDAERSDLELAKKRNHHFMFLHAVSHLSTPSVVEAAVHKPVAAVLLTCAHPQRRCV
jgi:hypothetical protein